MAASAEIVDEVGFAQLGDTLIVLWKGPATLARWQAQCERMTALANARRDGFICFDLILEGSTPPDAELRARMQADFKHLGNQLRRFVVVPLGDSIWLSVVRAIVRGVLLLSGQSRQQRVVDSLPEGLDQVRGAASADSPSKTELMDAIVALCHGLGVKPLAA